MHEISTGRKTKVKPTNTAKIHEICIKANNLIVEKQRQKIRRKKKNGLEKKQTKNYYTRKQCQNV